MGYFRVVGIGAQASEPIEKVALTATKAEVERSALQRLCGKNGRVEVIGKGGRAVTFDKLRRLAREEAMAGHIGDGAGAA